MIGMHSKARNQDHLHKIESSDIIRLMLEEILYDFSYLYLPLKLIAYRGIIEGYGIGNRLIQDMAVMINGVRIPIFRLEERKIGFGV